MLGMSIAWAVFTQVVLGNHGEGRGAVRWDKAWEKGSGNPRGASRAGAGQTRIRRLRASRETDQGKK